MQDRLSPDYWGEELRSEEVVNPLVFHFKPDRFIRVAPERLRDWEQLFLENVGLRPAREARAGGVVSYTVSGSAGGWDD
jgi:hypothetical protein